MRLLVGGMLAIVVCEATSSSCSASASQRATLAVQDIWNFAKTKAQDLPDQCLLLAQRDVHFEHNAMREIYKSKLFRCRTCGKMFKTSQYLDQHIDLRHSTTAAKAKRGDVCLGDFCSFLQCESTASFLSLTETHPERARVEHACRTVLATCFPPPSELFFDLVDQICEQGGETVFTSSKAAAVAAGGYSLFTVFSWFALTAVAFYYMFAVGKTTSRYMAMRQYHHSSTSTALLDKPKQQ